MTPEKEKYDELGDSLRTIRELKRENKKLKEDHQDFRELLKKYREIVSDEYLSDEEKLANIKASITVILIG